VRPTTPYTPADYTPGTQFTNPATPFMPTGGDYALSEVDEICKFLIYIYIFIFIFIYYLKYIMKVYIYFKLN